MRLQSREVFGCIAQEPFVRIPASEGEQRHQRLKREVREIDVWMRQVQTIGTPDAGSMWVHVGDRGANMFLKLKRYGKNIGISIAKSCKMCSNVLTRRWTTFSGESRMERNQDVPDLNLEIAMIVSPTRIRLKRADAPHGFSHGERQREISPEKRMLHW
jgi:hypothetical protein